MSIFSLLFSPKKDENKIKPATGSTGKAPESRGSEDRNTDFLNEILLRRKNKLIVTLSCPEHEQDEHEKALAVSAMKNAQALGFTFSKELLNALFLMNKAELERFYLELIPMLKKLVGADVVYTPMYPNFPGQVAEADIVELFINAIVHYWSGGKLMPYYEKNERLPLIEETGFTVLTTGCFDDVAEIFTDLLSSRTSLSPQDMDDILSFAIYTDDFEKYLPDEIPHKETVAYITAVILEVKPDEAADLVQKYFKTATDVLRFIVSLSNGDISLASKTRFKHLNRRERRMVMNLLAGCGYIVEDLFRYRNEWIRAAEYIHPFEYKSPKYKKVNEAFDQLRNGSKPISFGGRVQKALMLENYEKAADLLANRPGEFARQLDRMLRNSPDPESIADSFEPVAALVSTPVLLQVRQHFLGRQRDDDLPVRVFFPKGNVSKAYVTPNDTLPIKPDICARIVDICETALKKLYSEREPMGKVYIDSELSRYLVPFSQRSASKTAKSIIRGSSFPIGENAKYIRAFIWWTNMREEDDVYSDSEDGRVDIDLSVALYDENWGYMDHVSYTELASDLFDCVHSGDIVDGGAPEGDGASEFIDLNVSKNLAYPHPFRYAVFQVYSFTRQPFAQLPNVRFGWMERERSEEGEIYEPKTVKMSYDLNSNSVNTIPVIFDIVERRFIWCDMTLSARFLRRSANNLERNLKGATITCCGMVNLNKPDIYDLVMLNALARGEITENREDADIIFSNDTTVPIEIIQVTDEVTGEVTEDLREKTEVPIITAFDTDYFAGRLL